LNDTPENVPIRSSCSGGVKSVMPVCAPGGRISIQRCPSPIGASVVTSKPSLSR